MICIFKDGVEDADVNVDAAGTRARAQEGYGEDLIFLGFFRFSCIFDVSIFCT